MSGRFFPTAELKRTDELKPIKSYIPEDGRSPNPIWDDLARAVWPSTLENKTDREALAHQLMWAIYDESATHAPNVEVILARMTQNLMGNTWMKTWQKENCYLQLRKNSYITGFKKIFSK